MLNVRIIAAGAVGLSSLLATILTVNGALAQTATSDMTGHRVLLLKIVEQSTARPAPNAKLTAATAAKLSLPSRIRRHARLARKRHPAVTKIAQASAPEEVRLAHNPATTPPAPPQAPAPPAAEQFGPPLIGGHATQVAWSGEVNEKENDHPVNDVRLLADAAPSHGAAENDPPPPVVNAALKSDFANIAVAQHQGSDVGNTSWILQMLAVLGGAFTAGSLAWYLIGSRSVRFPGTKVVDNVLKELLSSGA